jgi:hypothetical protein
MIPRETAWMEESKGTAFNVMCIWRQSLPKPHHYFSDTVYKFPLIGIPLELIIGKKVE